MGKIFLILSLVFVSMVSCSQEQRNGFVEEKNEVIEEEFHNLFDNSNEPILVVQSLSNADGEFYKLYLIDTFGDSLNVSMKIYFSGDNDITKINYPQTPMEVKFKFDNNPYWNAYKAKICDDGRLDVFINNDFVSEFMGADTLVLQNNGKNFFFDLTK